MGQKVNPKVMRLGITRSWDSRWFSNKKQYADMLHQDLEIEKMIHGKLKDAGISKIEIHRTTNQVTISIHTSKPGMIIGQKGGTVEELKKLLERKFSEKFDINIQEIKKPALDAYLLAENVGRQIEKRISYRRAAKMAVEKAMEAGAKGVKIFVAGRLNGVEIARSEFFKDGNIPLQTFRADIDYAFFPAITTYGKIGVKVWIYKGEVFKRKGDQKTEEQQERPPVDMEPQKEPLLNM
jgi:small subunit ribosomal protein S3